MENENKELEFTIKKTHIAIGHLDQTIAAIGELLHCSKFVKGTMMISGSNDVHKILVWNEKLQIPESQLRIFIEYYYQALIAERNGLIVTVERLEKSLPTETNEQ